MGAPYTVLDDVAAETGGLLPYRVAIFPYNFAVPEAEGAAIKRYVEAGGKIIVFYAISDPVPELLGLRALDRTEGQFQTLRLNANLLPGAPESIVRASGKVRPIEPVAADTEIVGEWLGPDRQPLGVAGLAVSPNGAYMGHVLTGGDPVGKGRMLLALLGKLVSDIWQQAGAWAVSAAEWSYIASSPERLDEFRGVWLHDAYGVPGWGWERSARELSENGFDGIVANLLWGGLAHYDSKVLPVSPRVAEDGDRIAEALRWCRQYGIQLYVWKVNYNLAMQMVHSAASRAFVVGASRIATLPPFGARDGVRRGVRSPPQP